MKYLVSVVLAALAILPTLAQAQNAPAGVAVVERDKGAVRATRAVAAQGTITAIDQQTRHITIKGGGGDELTLVAGPEVKKFAQLKVGDIVTLKFMQSLALELKKGGTAVRGRVESSGSVTSKPGEAPAAGEAKTIQVTADVTAVNKKTGMVTLRGPQRTLDLQVKDQSMLDDIAVGDQVDATFVEAVAISVSTPKAGKK